MRPVHAVAVALPGADQGNKAVPDVPVRFGHVEPVLAAGVLIEQAQLDALGDLGEQAEVGSDAVVSRAQRIRLPWPHLHRTADHAGSLLRR